jgi:hypothetical protein
MADPAPILTEKQRLFAIEYAADPNRQVTSDHRRGMMV